MICFVHIFNTFTESKLINIIKPFCMELRTCTFFAWKSNYDFRNQIDDCCLNCFWIYRCEYKKTRSPIPCLVKVFFFQVYQYVVPCKWVYAVIFVHLDTVLDVLIKGCVCKNRSYMSLRFLIFWHISLIDYWFFLDECIWIGFSYSVFESDF